MRHPSALGRRVGTERSAGVPTHPPNQRKMSSRGRDHGFFLGVTQRKSGAIAAQPNFTTLDCGEALRYHRFLTFFGLFACSARFGKNGDFWAARPPGRSFDRPVRWYLRYLRARDAQSATLPLVYVTSGGSNLPVRPKKRPRVPAGQIQSGSFSTPGARFLALGDIS